VELYPHRTFVRLDNEFWRVDECERSTRVRWPARSDAVRVVIQDSSDPVIDAELADYSAETRAQDGCLEFDFFRSLEFPENNLHLELWTGGPESYDLHYQFRNRTRVFGEGVPRPADRPAERRYGRTGVEFYQHCFYAPAGDVWQPEVPGERMSTVHW
jgi:quinol monooxygenase YgiN